MAELTRLLLPALRTARGYVILINSGAGLRANPGWGAYAASKFALRAFGDVLRAEEPDLRVTSVHPGRIDTPMQRAVRAAEGGDYEPERYLRVDTSEDDVHQPARNDDHFARLAVPDQCGDPLLSQRSGTHLVLPRRRRHDDPAADPAVDLDRILDGVLDQPPLVGHRERPVRQRLPLLPDTVSQP